MAEIDPLKIALQSEFRNFLNSPEALKILDQRIEIHLQGLEPAQTLTRKQMAQMFQVSQQTIDRLTDEELEDRGYKRLKIGVSVRFERISNAKLLRKAC